MGDWEVLAKRLVEEYVGPQGISDPLILEAMKRVPRHLFIPEEYREYGYIDAPLPIGEEQTISQPFIVAKMTELLTLEKGNCVLEVGTGSGYQAALLAEMGMEVTTIERIEQLVEKAKSVFLKLCYDIHSILGDGREGYSPGAPYHGIIVTAGAPQVEEAWFFQLCEGGKIVVPLVADQGVYCLLLRKKSNKEEAGYTDTYYDYCRFVPLLSGVKKK